LQTTTPIGIDAFAQVRWPKKWRVVCDRGRSMGLSAGCGLNFFMTFLVRFWSSKNERKAIMIEKTCVNRHCKSRTSAPNNRYKSMAQLSIRIIQFKSVTLNTNMKPVFSCHAS